MTSSAEFALNWDVMGVLVVALDRTEAELEPGKLDVSDTVLLDRAELPGSIGLRWAELDGVLMLPPLLCLVELRGVLIPEAFTVDRTELLDGATIPPAGRLTPPYLGSRDRVFSAGFPILDVAAIPILDVDGPDGAALPAILPAFEGSAPAAKLVRDGAGDIATGVFFRMLAFAPP
jgi:hypothetical protein